MKSKKYEFVITKPIQYIQVKRLASQLDEADRSLSVIGNFTGSFYFYESIKMADPEWYRVRYFRSRFSYAFTNGVYTKLKCDMFFDSDIYKDSFLNFISSPLRRVSLFEEGYFSYVGNQDFNMVSLIKKIKLKIYRMLNMPLGLGASTWTKSYYLSFP